MDVLINVPVPGVDVPAPIGPTPASNPPSSRMSSEEQRANGLSPAQAADLLASLTALGVPAERLQAAAAASGVAYEPDTRTAAEKNFDAVLGAPPSDASGYRIDYYNRGDNLTMAELAAVDADARGFLAGLMFDPETGPGVVEEILDVNRATATLSRDDLATWHEGQRALVAKALKSSEAADQAYKIAEQMIDSVPGEVSKMAKRAMSASAVLSLYFQGRKIAARAG